MHEREHVAFNEPEPPREGRNDTGQEPEPSSLPSLRLDVAVLEERLTAADRIVEERENRIQDLRESLRVIHAAIMEAQAARTLPIPPEATAGPDPLADDSGQPLPRPWPAPSRVERHERRAIVGRFRRPHEPREDRGRGRG
jgi:hypothetical protein